MGNVGDDVGTNVGKSVGVLVGSSVPSHPPININYLINKVRETYWIRKKKTTKNEMKVVYESFCISSNNLLQIQHNSSCWYTIYITLTKQNPSSFPIGNIHSWFISSYATVLIVWPHLALLYKMDQIKDGCVHNIYIAWTHKVLWVGTNREGKFTHDTSIYHTKLSLSLPPSHSLHTQDF